MGYLVASGKILKRIIDVTKVCNIFRQQKYAKTYFFNIDHTKFGYTLQDVFNEISNLILKRESFTIYVSANLHAISLLRKDIEFCKALGDADMITFDGIAAIWLARLSGVKKIEKIGADVLMKGLYGIAERRNWRFYFLGGSQGAADRAAEKIKEYFPTIKIIGTHHGYFDSKEEIEIIKEINELSPDILVVGLGMPYQEKWIHRNKKKLKVGMITNCGAYIEQTANKSVDYYPNWAYKYNLNWLYRILKEPRRLWKRYFFDGIAFLPILCKATIMCLVRHSVNLVNGKVDY